MDSSAREEQQGRYHGGRGASKKMLNGLLCGTGPRRPWTDASAKARLEPKAGDKKTWKAVAATGGGPRGQARTRERKMRSLVRHGS